MLSEILTYSVSSGQLNHMLWSAADSYHQTTRVDLRNCMTSTYYIFLHPNDSYENAINAFLPFRDGELLKVWSASSKGNSATHSIWKMDTASMSCKAPRMLLTLSSSLLSKNATISFQMPTVKCEKHAAWWCTMMPKTEDGAIATALMKLWSFLSCQQTMLHTSCELPWLPHGSAGNCCVSTRHARRERVEWSIWIYRDGGTGCIYLYAQDTLIIWCHQQR